MEDGEPGRLTMWAGRRDRAFDRESDERFGGRDDDRTRESLPWWSSGQSRSRRRLGNGGADMREGGKGRRVTSARRECDGVDLADAESGVAAAERNRGGG